MVIQNLSTNTLDLLTTNALVSPANIIVMLTMANNNINLYDLAVLDLFVCCHCNFHNYLKIYQLYTNCNKVIYATLTSINVLAAFAVLNYKVSLHKTTSKHPKKLLLQARDINNLPVTLKKVTMTL
jgi:hypothetical protein